MYSRAIVASLLLGVFLCTLQAFKWQISEDLPYDRYFTFSERYMFADRDGPFLMNEGPSFIKIDLDISTYSKSNRSITIGMAIYAASEGHHDDTLDGICEPDKKYPNTWADYVEIASIPTKYDGVVGLDAQFVGLNGTYYHRAARIDYQYTVRKEAWHNVVFIVCPFSNYDTDAQVALGGVAMAEEHSTVLIAGTQDDRASSVLLPLIGGPQPHQRPAAGALVHRIHTSMHHIYGQNRDVSTSANVFAGVEIGQHGARAAHSSSSNGGAQLLDVKKDTSTYLHGSIEFHNPYGYIPAELFGILPFQTARVVAYVFFAVFFVGHYYQYRESTLHLHTAFLVVFLFALVEATLWFASYQNLNITGTPYCCPFPPLVVGSLILQVVRQTLSRTLLLIVCLGYGIVRPKLMTSEWAAVSVMSALYLLCAIVSQGAVIFFASEAHGNFNAVNAKLTPYKIPAMVLDVLFLTWIYLSVNATIRVLTEFQQSVKLNMYRQLVSIIGVFAVLFVVVTVVFMLDGMGFDFVPWQCAWLEQVLWESLNFAVLAAVCVVCRPTPTSQMLSYASQLPTEDPDLDDDFELHGSTHGANTNTAWSDKGRAYVYGDDEEERQEARSSAGSVGYYDVGRHAGNASSNGGGQVEMSTLSSARNPLSSGKGGLGKLGKKAAAGGAGKSAATRAAPPASAAAGGFDSLPTAEGEDEEYGLEQEEWD